MSRKNMSNNIKLSPKYGLNPTIPICFYCGNSKNEIVLCGKIGKGKEDIEAPMEAILDYEPCDECKEKFKQGILVIGVTTSPLNKGMPPIQKDGDTSLYPSGAFFVATKEWCKRCINDESMLEAILEKGEALMPDDEVRHIIHEYRQL